MNEDIEEDGDFLVNEKDKQIMLTADGVKKVEKFFHIEKLSLIHILFRREDRR